MLNMPNDEIDWKKVARNLLLTKPDDQRSDQAAEWRINVINEIDKYQNEKGFSLSEFLNLATNYDLGNVIYLLYKSYS